MNQLMSEIADELAALIKGGARHQDHLHETTAGKNDAGGMHFCPGCRSIVLAKRLKELTESVDQTQVHARYGVGDDGKPRSKRDEVFQRLTERKAIEGPSQVVPARVP